MNAKIKAAFDQAADSYDLHCDLQKITGDALLCLLKSHSFTSPHTIDLGCGTGLVTQKLFNCFQHQSFHAIDFSPHLLAKAAARLSTTHAEVYAANFDQLPSYLKSFDIIFSNMALHWSEHLPHTLAAITSLLNNKGILAFSIPLPGTLIELETHFSINPLIDAAAIVAQLKQNHCNILGNIHEKITLQFANTLSALQSIKKVGANKVIHRTSRHLKGKSFITNLQIRTLTYHIGYFLAQKRE